MNYKYIFTWGAIAKKFHYRNDAATIEVKQSPSIELMVLEWSWCDATCCLVHNSHDMYSYMENSSKDSETFIIEQNLVLWKRWHFGLKFLSNSSLK